MASSADASSSNRTKERPGATLKRVAVTGANGTVGQFVVKRLLAEGTEVRAASRAPVASQNPKLEWCSFQLGDPASTAELLTGCDALVHCAFEHVPGRYRGGEGATPAQFWQNNLGGTGCLLESCVTANTTRAIVLSSRAVFGPDSAARVLDDHSPTLPDTHYGALKRAEESLVRLLARNSELACASLRPTGIYGVLNNAANSKWYSDCAEVRRGNAITRVRSSTEVHGEDLADAVWRLLNAEHRMLDGRAYNCSDQLVSTRILARELNRLTGKALPLPPLTQPRGSPMRCPGLRELGWRPGGTARLRSTLGALLELLER